LKLQWDLTLHMDLKLCYNLKLHWDFECAGLFLNVPVFF
jgi:hypothetical protein